MASDGITILAGTTKGAFLLDGAADRGSWRVRGPFCDGWPINHVVGEDGGRRLWAAGGGGWQGAGVWRSDDGGESWTLSPLARGPEREAFIAANPEDAAQFGMTPAPPAPFDEKIETLWSLRRAGGTLWCGAKPANLYRSDDDGESWARVEGLANHPTREDWQPGGAGLTLHTIVGRPDAPEKLWIGISAAGVFATEDGGETWDRRLRRANAPEGAEGAGEVGWCVHNLALASHGQGGEVDGGGGGDLIYQQNHQGVFRSPDGGRGWVEITEGLPSGFGFPIAVHPRRPGTVWTLPLNGDSAGRYPPDAAAAVWRSRDGGDSWEACREGLPQEACFFTVLRQAMAVDRQDPAGVYFGTNSGSIFASLDEGDTWREIARHLPTVLSVEVAAA